MTIVPFGPQLAPEGLCYQELIGHLRQLSSKGYPKLHTHTHSRPWSPHEHNDLVMNFPDLNVCEGGWKWKRHTEMGCSRRLSALWTVLQIKDEPQHGHCSQLLQPVILSVKHASVDLLVCLLVAWTLRFGSYAYSKSSTKAPNFPDPSIWFFAWMVQIKSRGGRKPLSDR